VLDVRLLSYYGESCGKHLNLVSAFGTVVGVPSIFAKKPRMVARIFKGLTENGLQNQMDPLALPIPWDQQVRQRLLLKCYLSVAHRLTLPSRRVILISGLQLKRETPDRIFHEFEILSCNGGHDPNGPEGKGSL